MAQIGTGKRVFTGPLPFGTRVVLKSSFLYYLDLKYLTLNNPWKKILKNFHLQLKERPKNELNFRLH